MTPKQWGTIRFFSPKEKWGNPDKMNYQLVQAVDQLRRYVGRKIHIHCGYDMRSTGWHPKGRAVDLHIEGLHPMEQYIAATRFKEFSGIGVYLWWNSPGLHLDNRPVPILKTRKVWGSVKPKVYTALDLAFLKAAMEIKKEGIINGVA